MLKEENKQLLFEIMDSKFYGEDHLSEFGLFMLKVKETIDEDKRKLEDCLMEKLCNIMVDYRDRKYK